MIEINLLPERLRVKKKESMKLPSLPILPVVIGAVAFLVAFQIILIVIIQFQNGAKASLTNKYASGLTSNLQAQDLENSVKDLSFKVDSLEKLSNSRLKFAKKLNGLSDCVVPGVWFRSIDVKKGEAAAEPGILRQALVIEGSSVVSGDKEDGYIGKFVNSLKDNKTFSEDFDDIQLTKVERVKIADTEIMDFAVVCFFKKGRGI